MPIRNLASLVDVATAAGSCGADADGEAAAEAETEAGAGRKPTLTLQQFATTLSQLVRAVLSESVADPCFLGAFSRLLSLLFLPSRR